MNASRFPTIVCSVRTGDLFRIWPDGSALELDEDCLQDARDFDDVGPSRKDTEKFWSDAEGDAFRACPRVDCDDCDEDRSGYRREYNGSYTSDGQCYTLVPCRCDDGRCYALPGADAPVLLKSALVSVVDEIAVSLSGVRGAA